jgi:hypothetical protein
LALSLIAFIAILGPFQPMIDLTGLNCGTRQIGGLFGLTVNGLSVNGLFGSRRLA